jgi:regulator of sigma E protease
LTTLLAFAFVLGVLVFVHELGHFLAAKRVGIRVLKFQLGFNPTILSFRRGDTEYGIGALPLGGYVKMAGESAEEGRAGRPDEFLSKTKWQRFQVLVMGPVMNLLLAVVLLAVLLYRGMEVPAFEDQPPQVGVVTAGSPAAQSDLRPGDLILSVGGRGVSTWEEFLIAVGARPNREVEIELLRDGARMTKRVTPAVSPNESRFEIGDIGVLPNVHPRLISIVAGEPGEKAGLQVGDVVLAVNGEPMTFSSQLREAIAKHPDRAITIMVSRNGTEHDIVVTPARVGEIGRVGVGISDATKSIQPGLLEAIGLSIQQNIQMAGLIFSTVADLITRETSPRQLLGPVGIAQLSGESVALGWVALFGLMAQLSLNLGLINLLPIPVLDGGHIFIMALEGVARRDFSIRVKEKMLLAGLVVLVMLMGTAIYNDLTRISWIERLMPWR